MEKTTSLGSKVKDLVTGITGVATSKIEYLNGCVHYGVLPHCSKDGKNAYPKVRFIDFQQLACLNNGVSELFMNPEWNPWFDLGTKVECEVTGFRGIVTARYTNLSGLIEYLVVPKTKDVSKPSEGQYIPRNMLTLLGPGVTNKIKALSGEEVTGGPADIYPSHDC